MIYNRIDKNGLKSPPLKEDLKDLIIDYLKKGYSHKSILKEMEAVIFWELRDGGFLK